MPELLEYIHFNVKEQLLPDARALYPVPEGVLIFFQLLP